MKLTSKILFFLLIGFISVGSYSLYSQNPDIKRTYHWYFGDLAGIDFSSGSPVALTNGGMYGIEGCAAISDTSGNLLFYTDGDTVWNKNHLLMPNGTGLMGHWSGWQNSVIIPQPENSNIYYIFTADAFENGFLNGIRYSIVDISLNTGLGDVTSKNILLFAPNAEELAAVHHANCKDIWVMGHKLSTNDFYAYLVTSSGIAAPVITTIGNCINTRFGTGIGIEFSPDGSMLATNNFFDYSFNPAVRDTLELYLFDKSNGTLNTRIVLPDTSIYGYSFSPDSKKLYVCEGAWTTKVFQYDLSIYSQSSIAASKTLIFETDPSTYYLQMQITPDQKIFLDKYAKDTLSVIDNPNLLGVSCNYIDNGFSLGGRMAKYALPNFIESYFETTLCPTAINELSNSGDVFLYPNPANNFIYLSTASTPFSSISIFNMLGQKVMEGQTYSSVETIDISRLSSGYYFIQISFEKNILSTKKFIKQ